MPLATTPGASLGGIQGSTALARLLVVVSGNTSGLTKSLTAATGSLSGFQKNASTLGSGLIRGVTLPLLGIGGAAVKMAADYQQAMAQVGALTNLTGAQVEQFSDQILELATSGRVTAAPTELAHALYFSASAGLSAAQAFQVVRLSAEGAAVGMGDAGDISRVLIAALNGFADQGLTAADAMDALVAAVREGSAEPNELAISLGRLIPVADKVGLSFQEMVAQVAALTNIGVPTRVATTSLRALFAQFLAPTQQATENLAAFGITADRMRAAVEAGPVVAFKLLDDAVGGDIDVIRNVIPQIRGLTAYLGLAGPAADKTSAALNAVRNSSGSLNKALAIVSKTTSFQFGVAMNDLRVGAIKLGTTLLPIFNQIIRIISDVGESLSAIPSGMSKIILALLGLAAAAGPIIKIFGALHSSSGVLLGNLSAMGAGMLTMAASIAFATGSISSFMQGTAGLPTLLAGVAASFVALNLAINFLGRAANAGVFGVNALSLSMVELGAVAGPIAAVIAATVGVIALIINKQREWGHSLADVNTQLRQSAVAGDTLKISLQNMGATQAADDLRQLASALHLLNQPTGTALPKLADALGGDLLNSIEQLEALDRADPGYTISENFAKAIPVIQQAVAAGKDLGPAFKEAGFSAGFLDGALDDIQSNQFVTGDVANAIQRQVGEYDAATRALKDYQVQTASQIALAGAEASAVQSLANEYGVSTDQIQTDLSETGVAAIGMTDESKQQFAELAGYVDKSTGQIVGDLQAQKEAEQELVAQRQESVRQSVDLFGKVEDAAKASVASLTKSAQATARENIAMAANVGELIKRGLDPAVVQGLVDQGPAMVAKFVNASAGELGRLNDAYALSMGAIDATILREGSHQETKGNKMVSGFAEAILSNKDLPARAAQQIMNLVGEGLETGKMSNAGVRAVQDFTRGITQTSGLPKAQAGKIAVQFAQAVSKDPGILSGGADAASKFIRSFVSKLDLPAGASGKLKQQLNAMFNQGNQAQDVGRQFSREYIIGINSQAGQAKTTAKGVGESAKGGLKGVSATAEGRQLGASFAAGIRSSSALAAAAARGVANSARTAFQAGMHNSPELFTYYLGQRLIQDLDRGMKNGQQNLRSRSFRPAMDIKPGATNSGVADAIRQALGNKDIIVNVTTRVDSRDVSRAQYRDNLLRKS